MVVGDEVDGMFRGMKGEQTPPNPAVGSSAAAPAGYARHRPPP